jgi:branched-chain amino acid transport system permease protein
MGAVIEVVVSGLLAGAQYALAAVGMTLIFRVDRTLNLATGAFFALGAYLAYQATLLGLPAYAGAVPAAAAGVLLGAAVDRALVRPVREYPFAAAIVLLGLAILAEEGLVLVWGPANHSVVLRVPPALVGRVVVNTEQVITAAASTAILGALGLFLRGRVGLAVRATAGDPEVAAMAGIDVGRVHTATFAAACGMAAVAGTFLSPLLILSPTMGRFPLILTLSMVVVGGAGRIRGTLAASLGIGLASTIVAFYLTPTWSYILALALVTAALTRRADGSLSMRARPEAGGTAILAPRSLGP